MQSARDHRNKWKAVLILILVTLTAAGFYFRSYFLDKAIYLEQGVHVFNFCQKANKNCTGRMRDNKSNRQYTAPLENGNMHDAGVTFSLHVTEDDIETFSVGLPRTLPNYRNPCWMETIPVNFSYFTDSFYYLLFRNLSYKRWHYWGSMFEKMQKRIDWTRGTATGKHAKRTRCFPSFFLIGFTKCGTTDLYQALSFVPDIIHPITKEAHFWNWYRLPSAANADSSVSRRAELKDYLDLYDDAAEKARQYTIIKEDGVVYHPGVMGDFDPKTIWYYPDWKAIKGNEKANQPKYLTQHHLYRLNPKTKFLVLLRHPLDRMLSHYRVFCCLKNNTVSAAQFHNNVKTFIHDMNGCIKNRSVRYCVYHYMNVTEDGKAVLRRSIIGSMYYVFIKDWFSVFPREQFFFIKSEDYFKSRTSAIYDILDFLRLNRTIPKAALRSITKLHVINPSREKTMWRSTRLMVWNFLQPFNERLASMLHNSKWIWDYKVSS